MHAPPPVSKQTSFLKESQCALPRRVMFIIYISFIGIHKLVLCVTRGYGDHPPLTSDAALEEEKRNQLEHAAAARRERREGGPGRLGGDERWMRVDSQSGGPVSRAR